ncbi:MAG: hypothetical protein KJ579_01840, partial [Verrucomicrobia bacterium]|nr:hypothetical protein [Verrucomicrobiota bacterium]
MKTHPECPKVEPDLTSYLTGDLPAARAEAIRGHLTLCGSCRASAQELATTLDLLRGALAASPAVPERLDPARRAAVLAVHPSRATILLDIWLVPLARAAIFVIVPALILASLMLPSIGTRNAVVGKLSDASGATAGGSERAQDKLEDFGYTVGPAESRRSHADAPAAARERETLAFGEGGGMGGGPASGVVAGKEIRTERKEQPIGFGLGAIPAEPPATGGKPALGRS